MRLTDEQWKALYGAAEKAEPIPLHENIAHRAKRRTVREYFRAVIHSWTLAFRLAAVESELGIALIEATAHDQFQREMMTVASTPEGRQKIRDAALALGQLGISGYADVEKMVQGFYVMETYGLTIEHLRALAKLKAAVRNLQGGQR